MRLPYAVLLYALVAIALSACATGPTIRSNADPGTDFSQYDSFAFVPELESEDLGYQSFLVQYLKEAITREMTARGYTYSEENPGLLVNFYVNTQEKIQSRSTPTAGGGYYGYRRGYYGGWGGYETTVTQYTQGTLSIDVIDAARKQLVWEGVAVGRIRQSTLDDVQGAVNRVVPLIYQEYPYQAGIQ